jgi:hypothetical protein
MSLWLASIATAFLTALRLMLRSRITSRRWRARSATSIRTGASFKHEWKSRTRLASPQDVKPATT